MLVSVERDQYLDTNRRRACWNIGTEVVTKTRVVAPEHDGDEPSWVRLKNNTRLSTDSQVANN